MTHGDCRGQTLWTDEYGCCASYLIDGIEQDDWRCIVRGMIYIDYRQNGLLVPTKCESTLASPIVKSPAPATPNVRETIENSIYSLAMMSSDDDHARSLMAAGASTALAVACMALY